MANRYRTTLRPAGFGGLPQGVTYRYVEWPSDPHAPIGNQPNIPRSRYRYGIVETDRALTEAECEHFDIVSA